nr:hypothetical protein [Tanacetum cinerariifolium]
MALPPRDQRHKYLRYKGLQYTDADIVDFESRIGKIYRREVYRVQVFDFRGLTDLMAEGLSSRMLMEHRDALGLSVFISRAWRRLFEIKGPLAESARQIPDKGDLSAYWIGISSVGDFLGIAPSYTFIRDLMLRLCHRLIACSIAGRSKALEKVAVAGAPEVIKGVPDDVKGDQAVPTPVQAPQPPPPTRTMPQRMARLEEDVHEIRVALGEQREVMDAMARDFSRFTVWAARNISQLLDSTRATYVCYTETHVPYRDVSDGGLVRPGLP